MLSKSRILVLLLAAVSGVAITATGLWSAFNPDERDPSAIRDAYRAEFSIEPSSDIVDLHYRTTARNEHCWFRFRAAADSATALLRRFEPSDEKQFHRICRSGGCPTWGEPPEGGVAYYKAYDWLSDADSSVAVIAHHPATETIYFARYATD
jgi:hypothetical protein